MSAVLVQNNRRLFYYENNEISAVSISKQQSAVRVENNKQLFLLKVNSGFLMFNFYFANDVVTK